MPTRKRKQRPAEPLALPGMDAVVAEGPPAYRVEPGSVKASHVDAVLAGRADHITTWKREQFDALMRVLVSLRIDALELPFDTFTGSTCAAVRRGLKSYKASEIARAVRATARDDFARKRKPSLAAIIARVPEWLAMADDAAPQVRARTDVIADYLRLYPAAYEIDWWKSWCAVDDVEQHNTAVLEQWVNEMRDVINKSKLSNAQKKELLGARRR